MENLMYGFGIFIVVIVTIVAINQQPSNEITKKAYLALGSVTAIAIVLVWILKDQINKLF